MLIWIKSTILFIYSFLVIRLFPIFKSLEDPNRLYCRMISVVILHKTSVALINSVKPMLLLNEKLKRVTMMKNGMKGEKLLILWKH